MGASSTGEGSRRFWSPRRARYALLSAVWTVGVVAALVLLSRRYIRDPGLDTAIIVLVCFLCGLADGSLGMGYGTTLTPILLVMGYEPLDVVPDILVSQLLTGFGSVLFHSEAGNVSLRKGSAHPRIALTLAGCSIIGALIGVRVALSISETALKILIGGIILVAGIVIWERANHRFVYRWWKMLIVASVAAFNKALSGGGYGPLLTSGQVISGVDGRAAVAITSFAEAFTCLIGAGLFFIQGHAPSPGLLILVCGGAMLSVPFSAGIVSRLNERFLKRAIAIFTIALGLGLLIFSL